MQSTENVLETMYEKLDHFLKTETVVGDPIEAGEVTLIPIITASFGLGGGIGEEEKSGGGGGGVGCKISPDAILVIRGSEVTMMPVKNKGSLDKLIDKVPELIDKIEAAKNRKEKAATDQEKSESQTKEE
ncbi:putative spore protein YtfJ [Halanaerobium saccharolyticum]|uniref:Putative spore protein YtfJ n=1 Tax=Halanaerobium saccharolyticum TaxID=43595 RepID=A0A4R6LJR6_9FIRM|nr:spore germination protein GerW family protein [Halanaerobium saccharolyticum]TDO83506.1 putative spore protein YtfJ [Halanaerobium saccharolyticum]